MKSLSLDNMMKVVAGLYVVVLTGVFIACIVKTFTPTNPIIPKQQKVEYSFVLHF